MENELREHIQKLINENDVILFMKGNPDAPACGFSARAAGALNALGKRYAAVDILPDPRIREELTAISDWPTIPQLFVNHELVGGSDIMVEMYETGELAELLGVEQPDAATESAPTEPTPQPQAQGLQLETRLD
ncbi:MAG: Grx4 family monothiol glutaredoxin [Solirubrobacterales bacterium]